MAFGLAVYASPGGLPHHDARLASSRWSDATGRAFHPQGSDERFQSACLHLVPLSRALPGANTSTAAASARSQPRRNAGAVLVQTSSTTLAGLGGDAKYGMTKEETKTFADQS